MNPTVDTELKIHPYAEIFPMMNDKEFQRLKADIEANGMLEGPVVDHLGRLVDGRNRLKACQELGMDIGFLELPEGADIFHYVMSANLHRRQMTTSQRAMCAAKLPACESGQRNDLPQICGRYTAEQAAAVFGIGTRTVEHARNVLSLGADWLISLCESGKSVATASRFVNIAGGELFQTKAVDGADDRWKAVCEYVRETAAQNAWIRKQDNVARELGFGPAINQFHTLWDGSDESTRAAIVAFALSYNQPHPKAESRKNGNAKTSHLRSHPIPAEEL